MTIKNQSGFSLVELMVTVAIIGILAATAIPSFIYFTYRAHQTEAMVNLATIYTAEQAFRAEAGFYTCCLYQAGYMPESTYVYYTTGFWGNCGNWSYNSQGSMCSGAVRAWNNSVRNDATFEANSWANPSLTGAGYPGIFGTFAPDSFSAVAFGSISQKPRLDTWSVDQNKVFVNVHPGF